MEINTGANSTLAIGGVTSPIDTFVVAESSVLRMKFSAKSPPIANLQNVSTNFMNNNNDNNGTIQN